MPFRVLWCWFRQNTYGSLKHLHLTALYVFRDRWFDTRLVTRVKPLICISRATASVRCSRCRHSTFEEDSRCTCSPCIQAHQSDTHTEVDDWEQLSRPASSLDLQSPRCDSPYVHVTPEQSLYTNRRGSTCSPTPAQHAARTSTASTTNDLLTTASHLDRDEHTPGPHDEGLHEIADLLPLLKPKLQQSQDIIQKAAVQTEDIKLCSEEVSDCDVHLSQTRRILAKLAWKSDLPVSTFPDMYFTMLVVIV